MNEEILGGLKIAIEKGSSLEEAVQSFINAGYNPAEVREAAGFVARPARIFQPLPPYLEKTTAKIPSPPSSSSKIIIAVIVLLVLVVIAIFSLIFKEQIMGLFG